MSEASKGVASGKEHPPPTASPSPTATSRAADGRLVPPRFYRYERAEQRIHFYSIQVYDELRELLGGRDVTWWWSGERHVGIR